MSFGAIAVGVISIGATAINNKNNRDQADRLAGDAEDRYNREQALLEIEKQKYRDMESTTSSIPSTASGTIKI